MQQFVAAAAFIAIALVVTSGAQNTAGAALQDADVAWERGDYVTALTMYQQLLAGPEAASVLEPIALQTGELYHTTGLTDDGNAPQLSPDGRYATYETGPIANRVTHLVTTDGSASGSTELRGYGAVFSQDGSRIAYLRMAASSAFNDAAADLERAPQAERTARTASLTVQSGRESVLVVRHIPTGRETTLATGGLSKASLTFGSGNLVFFAGDQGTGAPTQIYSAAEGREAIAVTSGGGAKAPAVASRTGDSILYTTRTAGTGPGGAVAGAPVGAGGAGGGAAGRGAATGGGRGGAATYGVLTVAGGQTTPLGTTDRPSFSRDGKTLAYVARTDGAYRVMVAASDDPARATAIRTGPERLEATALSPDGSRVSFQMMAKDDFEIYVINRDGTAERRLTREIQHDVLPQFLDDGRLLAVIGEPRHRRSYLYDVTTGARTRLFHNNTIRTIAPEYSWTPSADGTKILISAERDGDTVSAARGVYVMDLARKVTREELRTRIAANLTAERALRTLGQRMYAPIAAEVKAVVAQASVPRVYSYEKTLFDFDSKHISQPGNRRASTYLFEAYKSFGYQPDYQWFEPRGALDGRSANVVATLKGTVDPELIYVVSSHYDSVAVGPGADDDSTGTAALLETARILSKHPQPATIVFASFTGEEAGLLGSREFVRRAVADKIQVVGALNNDMVGWANDYRLDNTIRYSNPGIRDVQHAAAIEFTNLITYDALYYKNTDAAAYYEAYGDIVGGIGSYPVLGNPHYHQPHDFLETINHQLVTEVAKTTAATLMLLASSPSRLADLKVGSVTAGTATLSWKPAVERDVNSYMVLYGPPDTPEASRTRLTVNKPSVSLTKVTPGTVFSVKAVNGKGLEGWDWARVVLK